MSRFPATSGAKFRGNEFPIWGRTRLSSSSQYIPFTHGQHPEGAHSGGALPRAAASRVAWSYGAAHISEKRSGCPQGKHHHPHELFRAFCWRWFWKGLAVSFVITSCPSDSDQNARNPSGLDHPPGMSSSWVTRCPIAPHPERTSERPPTQLPTDRAPNKKDNRKSQHRREKDTDDNNADLSHRSLARNRSNRFVGLVGFHQLRPSSHSLYRLKAKMSSAMGQIIFRTRQTIFI
jgi:hypothetical protein